MTTFKRKAATPRKITGKTVAMVSSCLSSSVMNLWEKWSCLPYAPSPP